MAKIITCLVCGKEVKQSAGKIRRFCSASCRAMSWRLGKTATPCFYCGVPADSIDHIPPKSVRPFIIAERLHHKYPFTTVDACRECNSLLGSRPIWDMPKRKRFIKRVLRFRYRKLLNGVHWSPTEKSELGYSLQDIVEMKELNRRVVEERLKW